MTAGESNNELFFDLSQIKLLAPCLREHVKPWVADILMVAVTAVVGSPRPTLVKRGGLKAGESGIGKDKMVTAAHRHSEPQSSHQCVLGFFGGNRISNGRGSGQWKGVSGSGPPELSLVRRHATTESATTRPLSMRVWCLTDRAGSFLRYRHLGCSIALPQ
ncbi:hypothetical protein EVAR_94589_1 [Eumeta japonica]|uniref:Uncharacterized protein n=1 Tax=Eumeta variegata TaxID=151549 RepID=A0A4C1UU53_EUMVA|nr:hypothetical protein EVAR_94589_1 [Eumeta japonica]